VDAIALRHSGEALKQLRSRIGAAPLAQLERGEIG
jgi:hypothetical protein